MADAFENRLLAGRYQIVSKLGQGGMGSVWCAYDRNLRIQVAVKLIDADIAGNQEAQARFQREALAAAQLRSTHIVHITDHGIDGDTPFIAMELLEGESLAARLHRLGKLSHAETVRILTQVARALTVAHNKGIAHRDLKPDNVFIVNEGDVEVVKVLDFGIAKRLDAQSYSGGVKTRTGTLLGTPYYMSPEQAHGKGRVDHRTDIWSLGVIAYECITGRRPFDEETLAALLLAICSEAPPVPSSVALVPSGFDEWFSRATSRDLDLRFSTATEAAQALAALGRSTGAQPTASFPDVVNAVTGGATTRYVETVNPSSVTNPGVVPKAKASPATVLLMALPAAVALGGIGLWFYSRSNAQEPATIASEVLAVTPVPSQENVSLPAAAATPSIAPVSAPLASAVPPNAMPSTATPSAPVAPVVVAPAVHATKATKPQNNPQVAAAPAAPAAVARQPASPEPRITDKPKKRDYAKF